MWFVDHFDLSDLNLSELILKLFVFEISVRLTKKLFSFEFTTIELTSLSKQSQLVLDSQLQQH